MKLTTLRLLILLLAGLMWTCAESKDTTDGTVDSSGRPDNSPTPNNSSVPCVAGDYDTDSDGKTNFSITCHDKATAATRISYFQDGATKDYEYTYWGSSGKQKTLIVYQSDGKKKEAEVSHYESNGNPQTRIVYGSDGATKRQEYSYWETGELKMSLEYDKFGRGFIDQERTYYKSGKLKTWIKYYNGAEKLDNYPKCYQEDGLEEEDCALSKHGCDPGNFSCIDNTAFGGGWTNCVPGDYDINGDGGNEYTLSCHPNGNRATYTEGNVKITHYESNGYPKTYTYRTYLFEQEKTYYESSGKVKTETSRSILHNDNDGIYTRCYQSDGTEETCAAAKHGCDAGSYSCADNTLYGGGLANCTAGDYDTDSDGKTNFSITCHDNGNRKGYIAFERDGTTKKQESAYYESEGGIATFILYHYKSSMIWYEDTFYESKGQLKSRIEYEKSGVKSRTHRCYKTDGTEETCAAAKHGCDAGSYSCVDNTLYGGGLANCTAGDYDTDSDGKTNFSITCHGNGKRQSYVVFADDGATKRAERSYYAGNSNLKSYILYFEDGASPAKEVTYYESTGAQKTLRDYSFIVGAWWTGPPLPCWQADGTEEPCTIAKHGCDAGSYSCLDNTLHGGGLTNCVAGSYDPTGDGKTDFDIACHSNGKRKELIGYSFILGALRTTYNEEGRPVSSKWKKTGITFTYHANGKRATVTDSSPGAGGYAEDTYYENGRLKTQIAYRDNGSLSNHRCYKPEGGAEPCTVAKHGCDAGSYSCIDNRLYGGSLTSCVAGGYDTNGDNKSNFHLSCYANGNRSAATYYLPDGETKSRHVTYYESNGAPAVDIRYYPGGLKPKNRRRYDESSGQLSSHITYYRDGTQESETVYYTDTGVTKSRIEYHRDGAKYSFSPECFRADALSEPCTMLKHACTPESSSCLP